MDLLSFNIKEVFNKEKFSMAMSWLPVDERPLVTRFKFKRDQHLALSSLLLRRHYFSNLLDVGWYELQFDRLSGGKPILKGQKELDYNISHEGDWVILAAIKEKDKMIGVDTVVIDRSIGSIDSFVKSFESQLTKNEMELIFNSNDPLKTFFELWGCKESYIKAIGVGLSFELNKIDFLNINDQIKMNFEDKRLESWCFHLSYLDDTSLVVICCGNNNVSDRDQFHDFFRSTQLLGQPSHTAAKEIFKQVKFNDLQNNKWLFLSRT